MADENNQENSVNVGGVLGALGANARKREEELDMLLSKDDLSEDEIKRLNEISHEGWVTSHESIANRVSNKLEAVAKAKATSETPVAENTTPAQASVDVASLKFDENGIATVELAYGRSAEIETGDEERLRVAVLKDNVVDKTTDFSTSEYRRSVEKDDLNLLLTDLMQLDENGKLPAGYEAKSDYMQRRIQAKKFMEQFDATPIRAISEWDDVDYGTIMTKRGKVERVADDLHPVGVELNSYGTCEISLFNEDTDRNEEVAELSIRDDNVDYTEINAVIADVQHMDTNWNFVDGYEPISTTLRGKSKLQSLSQEEKETKLNALMSQQSTEEQELKDTARTDDATVETPETPVTEPEAGEENTAPTAEENTATDEENSTPSENTPTAEATTVTTEATPVTETPTAEAETRLPGKVIPELYAEANRKDQTPDADKMVALYKEACAGVKGESGNTKDSHEQQLQSFLKDKKRKALFSEEQKAEMRQAFADINKTQEQTLADNVQPTVEPDEENATPTTADTTPADEGTPAPVEEPFDVDALTFDENDVATIELEHGRHLEISKTDRDDVLFVALKKGDEFDTETDFYTVAGARAFWANDLSHIVADLKKLDADGHLQGEPESDYMRGRQADREYFEHYEFDKIQGIAPDAWETEDKGIEIQKVAKTAQNDAGVYSKVRVLNKLGSTPSVVSVEIFDKDGQALKSSVLNGEILADDFAEINAVLEDVQHLTADGNFEDGYEPKSKQAQKQQEAHEQERDDQQPKVELSQEELIKLADDVKVDVNEEAYLNSISAKASVNTVKDILLTLQGQSNEKTQKDADEDDVLDLYEGEEDSAGVIIGGAENEDDAEDEYETENEYEAAKPDASAENKPSFDVAVYNEAVGNTFSNLDDLLTLYDYVDKGKLPEDVKLSQAQMEAITERVLLEMKQEDITPDNAVPYMLLVDKIANKPNSDAVITELKLKAGKALHDFDEQHFADANGNVLSDQELSENYSAAKKALANVGKDDVDDPVWEYLGNNYQFTDEKGEPLEDKNRGVLNPGRWMSAFRDDVQEAGTALGGRKGNYLTDTRKSVIAMARQMAAQDLTTETLPADDTARKARLNELMKEKIDLIFGNTEGNHKFKTSEVGARLAGAQVACEEIKTRAGQKFTEKKSLFGLLKADLKRLDQNLTEKFGKWYTVPKQALKVVSEYAKPAAKSAAIFTVAGAIPGGIPAVMAYNTVKALKVARQKNKAMKVERFSKQWRANYLGAGVSAAITGTTMFFGLGGGGQMGAGLLLSRLGLSYAGNVAPELVGLGEADRKLAEVRGQMQALGPDGKPTQESEDEYNAKKAELEDKLEQERNKKETFRSRVKDMVRGTSREKRIAAIQQELVALGSGPKDMQALLQEEKQLRAQKSANLKGVLIKGVGAVAGLAMAQEVRAQVDPHLGIGDGNHAAYFGMDGHDAATPETTQEDVVADPSNAAEQPVAAQEAAVADTAHVAEQPVATQEAATAESDSTHVAQPEQAAFADTETGGNAGTSGQEESTAAGATGQENAQTGAQATDQSAAQPEAQATDQSAAHQQAAQDTVVHPSGASVAQMTEDRINGADLGDVDKAQLAAKMEQTYGDKSYMMTTAAMAEPTNVAAALGNPEELGSSPTSAEVLDYMTKHPEVADNDGMKNFLDSHFNDKQQFSWSENAAPTHTVQSTPSEHTGGGNQTQSVPQDNDAPQSRGVDQPQAQQPKDNTGQGQGRGYTLRPATPEEQAMLARNNSRVASDTQATTGTTRVDVSDDSAAAATAATVTTVTDSVALIEHDLAAQGFTRVHPQLTATLNHTGNAGATYGYREVLWDPLHHKVALIANNPTMDQLDGNGVTIMSEKGALNLLRSHSGAWSFNRGDMHEAYVRRVENTGVTNYTSLYGTGTTTSVSTNGKGFTETVYGLNEAIYAVGETAHTLTGTLHEAKGLANFISGKGPRGC